jgi:gamma-glutamyltranspeptidase/glutathione hydrolase
LFNIQPGIAHISPLALANGPADVFICRKRINRYRRIINNHKEISESFTDPIQGDGILKFDCHFQPYPSNRYTQIAQNAMVATSHPLAANAGMHILRNGGNAVDAAVAMAACLSVVEPTSNGIGGDAFALVWIEKEQKLYGINGSGYSPQSISIEAMRNKGYTKMPTFGWDTVTVPGQPATWAALVKRFGKLPMTETLAPAIGYARDGYPVSTIVGYYWEKGYERLKAHLSDEVLAEWHRTYMPGGKAPKAGNLVKLPNHARTLADIAATNAESFYRGALAAAIDQSARTHGGFITKDDLAAYQPEWVEPISVNYKGYDICEIPPNGQGIVALIALNILKGFNFAARDDIDTFHKQFEAIKLAFADGKKYVTDAKHMTVSPEDLLTDAYGAERRKLIGTHAQDFNAGSPAPGGTVYLCTADAEGNMVSYIQSNYLGFGSGAVVEGTGIGLQNRGADFSLDPSHDNCLAGGKRTYHTIIPGFIMKDQKAVGPFGVMGAYMQPQGHVQVIMNMLDFGLNPQMALDAPRWQWTSGKKFIVEPGFPSYYTGALERLGHDIIYETSALLFGRGQIIWRENGVYYCGTESRTDGTICCY